MKAFYQGALFAVCATAAGISPAYAQAKLFDVPAQPVSSAVSLLGHQAEIQIVAAERLTNGKNANAVKGNMTVEEALRRLLEGTGLAARRIGPSSFTIVADPSVSPTTAGQNSDTTGSTDSAAADIIVTGSNIRGGSPTSPVIEISRKDIEQSGRSSVADVIRTLPQNFNGGQNTGNIGGGAANQDLTGASSPNLRGLGTASTLTLVDGHRLAFDGYQGGPDISVIPLAAVESVEVLTDGASAIYGSDAVAGVVNIKLRDDFDGAETRARIAGTTDGGAFQQQYSAIAGHHWGTGNAVLSYEFTKTDPLDRSQRDFATQLSSNTYYLIPAQQRHSLFGSFKQHIGSDVSIFLDGVFTHRTNSSITSAAAYEDLTHFSVNQYSANGGVDVDLSANWHANVTATIAEDVGRESGYETAVPSGDVTTYTPDTFRNRVRGVEGTANGVLLRLPSGEVKIAVGGGYRWTQFIEQYVSSTSGPHRSGGSRGDTFAYGEMLVPLVPEDPARTGLTRLMLSVAARYDHFSDFGSTTNPKIGLAYRPIPSITLRGSWSRSFRAPEIYYEYGEPQRYLFSLDTPQDGKSSFLLLYGANPNLGPERSTAWNASIEFKPNRQNDSFVRLSGFAINYKNRVDFPFSPYTVGLNNPDIYSEYYTYNPSEAVQAAAIGGFRLMNYSNGSYDPNDIAFILNSLYTNVGRVRARGVDVDFRYDWPTQNGSISLNGSASYLLSKQQVSPSLPTLQTSNTIFHPPSFRGRMGASWTAGDMTASGFVNYTGSYKNNLSSTQRSVGSWTTIDAQVAYAPRLSGFASGLSIAVSVQNLLNTDPPKVAADSFSFLSGLGYDSTNASPLGRVMAIELVKRW